MAKYVFDPDRVLTIKNGDKADPQKIGAALEVISAKAGGHLTPDAVVDAAKDRKSILHRHFEWNDEKAAHAYRLDQARSVIRAIHMDGQETENGMARAFMSIREKSGTTYRNLNDVLNSQDLQQRVLAQAERDLLAWETRYKSIEDVCSLVKAARERLSARRTSVGQDSRAA